MKLIATLLMILVAIYLFDSTGVEAPGSTPVANADTTSFVKIANETEPGERMLIRGIVFDNDGTTPVSGARVHVYHTDASGLYAPKGSPNGTHRLYGHMVTDDNGKYSFETVRPGSYPGSRAPAHVHIHIKRSVDADEEWFALEFSDDKFISRSQLARERKRGRFTSIIDLTHQDNMLTGAFNVRLK